MWQNTNLLDIVNRLYNNECKNIKSAKYGVLDKLAYHIFCFMYTFTN